MKILALLSLTLALSCSLSEPSSLEIINDSEFRIKVYIEKSNLDEFVLDKGKGSIVYVAPGEINIEIRIDEMNLSWNYSLNIGYLEKKKFEFDLN